LLLPIPQEIHLDTTSSAMMQENAITRLGRGDLRAKLILSVPLSIHLDRG